MTNATIPAGSPSASQLFRWESADKGVAVHLSLDLVERLERETIEAFKTVTRRGSEIGGLLLGKTASAGRRLVLVDGFEPVQCDHARGPLYMFAEEDKKRLEQAIAKVKASGGTVAGFFRSNTRRDLCLDEDDLALMKEFFADPVQVCLIVKPFAMKPSVGGLFFWEAGRINGAEPHEPFPFRRPELEKLAHLIIKPDDSSLEPLHGKRTAAPPPVQSAPKPPEKSAAPPPFRREERPAAPPPPPKEAVSRTAAPPAMPKREEKPVSPLAFRRDDRPAISPVKPEVRPAGPVLVKKEEPAAPAEQKPAAAIPQPPKRDEKPAAPPLPVRGGAVPAAAAAKPPEKAQPAAPASEPKAERPPAPAAKSEPAPPVRPRPEPPASASPHVAQGPSRPAEDMPAASRRGIFAKPWLWAAVLVLALGAGATYKFVYLPGFGQQTQQADALSLKVERSAGQLLLTWNRSAAAIQTASRAILTINDGEHREDVDLELGQLRNGNIVYSPMTNDVSFRLEVTDVKGGKSVSESMRVLAGRPSPAVPVQEAPQVAQKLTPAPAPAPAPQSETQAAAAPKQTEPAKTVEQASAAAPQAPTEPTVTATPAVTVQPPKPESLAARLSAPVEVIDLPQISTQGSTSLTAAAMPGLTPRVPSAPPPEPAASRSGSQRPASPPKVNIGGQVVPAQLVRRAPTSYPALARQARISGTVRVEAVIGKDGRVKSARAVSGPPLLRRAAEDSVKQWVYTPALLNGAPAETTTQVDLNFLPGR